MLKERDTHIDKTGLKEILWFVGLWILGVAILLIVGGVIKVML